MIEITSSRNRNNIRFPEEESLITSKFLWLLAGLGLLALIKIYAIVHFPVDLHSEEAQYWVWSKHLQLSYYSKPPLIAYLNRISTTLLGDTVLGVRINAVITGFLVSIATYFLSWEIFRNTNKAIIASIVTCIFPFLISISVYFSTDTPLFFFWICAMLFFWKALKQSQTRYWILFGISVGLGALSKYSMFLIFVPLSIFMLLYHREIFRNRNFYLSVLISLVIFSPVVYWNIEHRGIGLLHLVGLTGVHAHTTSLKKVLSNIVEYAAGQFAILLPFYQYKTIYRKFRRKTISQEEAFLILPALCMFLIFLVIAIIRKSGAYINWTMYAYTGIPILFAHFAIDEKKLKVNLKISGIMTFLLMLFAFLTSPANKILPLGKINPANKMTGWSQLANKVDDLRKSVPEGQSFVFSGNYHIASELWFYLKEHPETYVLNLNSRMTQFDLWPGIEQFAHTDKTGIFVDVIKITPEIRNGFSAVVKEDSCVIYNQNRKIETFYIYFLKNLNGFPKQHASY